PPAGRPRMTIVRRSAVRQVSANGVPSLFRAFNAESSAGASGPAMHCSNSALADPKLLGSVSPGFHTSSASRLADGHPSRAEMTGVGAGQDAHAAARPLRSTAELGIAASVLGYIPLVSTDSANHTLRIWLKKRKQPSPNCRSLAAKVQK